MQRRGSIAKRNIDLPVCSDLSRNAPLECGSGHVGRKHRTVERIIDSNGSGRIGCAGNGLVQSQPRGAKNQSGCKSSSQRAGGVIGTVYKCAPGTFRAPESLPRLCSWFPPSSTRRIAQTSIPKTWPIQSTLGVQEQDGRQIYAGTSARSAGGIGNPKEQPFVK